jgi:hypothetical protein
MPSEFELLESRVTELEDKLLELGQLLEPFQKWRAKRLEWRQNRIERRRHCHAHHDSWSECDCTFASSGDSEFLQSDQEEQKQETASDESD